MIDEKGRNCTVVADGRSDVAVPLCSERASDAHLTLSLFALPTHLPISSGISALPLDVSALPQ